MQVGPEGQALLSFQVTCGFFEYRRSIIEATTATPALASRRTMRWAIVNVGSLGAALTKLRHPLRYVLFCNGIRVTSRVSEWFTPWDAFLGWNGTHARVWLLYKKDTGRSMIPDIGMSPQVAETLRACLCQYLGAAIPLPPILIPELDEAK